MGKNQSMLRTRKNSQKSLSFTNELTHKTEEDCRFLIKTEDILGGCSIDDDEIARLDILHFSQKELWNKTIFSAPITKQLEEIHGFRVLDVG